jgi:hypothetical protein
VTVSMPAARTIKQHASHPHEPLERGPVEGLALECGHIASHDCVVFPLGRDLVAKVGWCCREALGGMDRARRGTKNGPAGTQRGREAIGTQQPRQLAHSRDDLLSTTGGECKE